jgi:hypothetical protein
MSQDKSVKERLSYLLLKNNEYLECFVNCNNDCDSENENSENENENCEKEKNFDYEKVNDNANGNHNDNMIINNNNKNNNNGNIHSMKIKVCSANLFECVLINKQIVFNSVLEYLDSEYAGYFMYYGKTIEDRFNLKFEIEDSLVKINGEGTNSLGNFTMIGYMNFYRSKGEKK